VKHLLQYLRATKELALMYDCNLLDTEDPKNYLPQGFSDSDWGGDCNTYNSTGIVFTYLGGPIHRTSKAQKCIALSTTEAELNALSDATKHAIYLRQLFHDLGLHVNKPLRIHVDNQGALTIAQSRPGEYHPRSKHYGVKIANVRHRLAKHAIQLTYLPTQAMIADLLTKAPGGAGIEELRYQLNIVDLIAALKGRVKQ